MRLLLPVVHADYSPVWGGVPYPARWAQAEYDTRPFLSPTCANFVAVESSGHRVIGSLGGVDGWFH